MKRMSRFLVGMIISVALATGGYAQDYLYWQSAQTAEGLEISRIRLPKVSSDIPPSKETPLTVEIKPIKDAAKYQILRIPTAMPGTLSVTVENQGSGTLYYWLVGHMGLFRSPIAGPFEAKGCDLETTKNKIKVEPGVFSYSGYTVLCTNSAQVPAGDMHVLTAWGIPAREITDTRGIKNLAQYPCWPQGTAETFPPVGKGAFLVGDSTGDPVQDTGVLKTIDLPPVNSLQVKTPPKGFPQGKEQVVAQNPSGNGILALRANNTMPHGRYNWGGPRSLYIEQWDYAGGHNDYPQFAGAPRQKSFHIPFHIWQHNFTAGQMASQVIFGEKLGEGDNVLMTIHTSTEGLIDDGGDEGTEIFMSSAGRKLKVYDYTLADDVAAHSATLPTTPAVRGNVAGEGRVVVNLTKAIKTGVITRIDDDMIEDPNEKRTDSKNRVTRLTGKGTNWTPEMAGWYISLDCDTTKSGFRQWFRIRRVNSSTSMDIHAYTYFSRSSYLGKASNVEYHGLKYREGYKMEPRPLGVMPGTPEYAARKKDETFLLAPATALASPTTKGSGLHVLPTKEAWSKGDKIQVIAGPHNAVSLGKMGLSGELLPQDFTAGLWLYNWTDRLSNDPGINLMGRWSTGVGITLDGEGLSSGVVVKGKANPDGAAFVAPADTNALRVQGVDLTLSGKAETGELLISEQTHDGAPVLALSKSSVRVGAGKTFGGSDMLRGVIELSGDGKTSQFICAFPGGFAVAPHVVASSNLPIGMGVVTVDEKGFTVTFAAPPAAGEKNIRITWIAME